LFTTFSSRFHFRFNAGNFSFAFRFDSRFVLQRFSGGVTARRFLVCLGARSNGRGSQFMQKLASLPFGICVHGPPPARGGHHCRVGRWLSGLLAGLRFRRVRVRVYLVGCCRLAAGGFDTRPHETKQQKPFEHMHNLSLLKTER
jgi:hypothetical protein